MMSVLLILLYMVCLAGIVCYPKTEGKLNGVKLTAVGTALLLCMEAAACRLFYRVHIPVNCISAGAALALCAGVLWYGIWRKRRIQKLFWRKADVIGILLLTVSVCLVSVRLFGLEPGLLYPKEWVAENFAGAMHVVRGQAAENVGTAAVIEALFIQLLAPFSSPVMSYKGYLFAALFVLLTELWLFYAVVLSISRRKIVCVLAPVFTFAYFWGYPAYFYMQGNDVSFSIRSIVLLLLVYALCLPVLRDSKERRNLLLRREMIAVSAVCIAVAVFWRSFSGVAEGREIYASMYGDLVFFVPTAVYACYHAFFKKKKDGAVCIMSIAAVVCVLVLYHFWYDGAISTYGYYQNYAVLWLFGWLLAVQALDLSAENGELAQFFSYAGMIGVLAVFVLSGFANAVSLDGRDRYYVTKSFFSLYRNNEDYLIADYGEYRIPDDTLEIYEEVLLNYSEYEIPLLTWDTREQLWYEALADQTTAEYRFAGEELPEALKRLDENGVRMIVVQKDAEEYQAYRNYFDGCKTVSESATAVLYQAPENGWTDVSGTEIAQREEKAELYGYVKEQLAGEQVPLMAAKEAYLDFLMYEDSTGIDSSGFYTWEYNARDNISNLNAQGVKYVVLLKDDAYAINNSAYYDTQETVYENEVGRVVRCIGEEWGMGE